MTRRLRHLASWSSAVLCGVVLAPIGFAQTALDGDLQKLYQKYGRDSVTRKVLRDNPKPAAEADTHKVPDDAFAPPSEGADQTGLRLFKGQPFPLLIRRSYSDVTAGEDPTVADPKESVRDAEPAQFSYSYDYLTRATQWSAIGALITPITVYQNHSAASHDGLALEKLHFVPSVSFDRVTNNEDKTQEVDELIFRAGLFGKWLGIAGPLRLLKISGYATYATNSQAEDGIVAGEFDIEPITSLHGNRTFYRLWANGTGKEGRAGSLVEYHWTAKLHNEFGGHTGSAFSAPDATDNNNFFRLGPTVSLQVDPLFLQRMNASVDYSYLAGLSGAPSSSHHFMARLGLILDPNPDTDHWSLNATYEDGDTPLVKKRVRTFLLTLGVKY